MHKIAILICCYNRQDVLIRQLKYLDQNVVKYRDQVTIYVHDDGSEVPISLCESTQIPLILSRTESNSGLISARNILIRSAIDSNQFFLFLDDDLFLYNIDLFIEKSIDSLGAGADIAYCPYINLPLSSASKVENFKYFLNLKPNSTNVANFNGGASFFSKSAFDKVPNFFGDYYIYLEEEDFCFRLFLKEGRSVRLTGHNFIGIHDQQPGKNFIERRKYLLSNRFVYHYRFIDNFILRNILNASYVVLYFLKFRDVNLILDSIKRYQSIRRVGIKISPSMFNVFRFLIFRYLNFKL